jgi:hypothetical protein
MLGWMLDPSVVCRSNQQMRVSWSFKSKQVVDVGFTIGDRNHLYLGRHHILGLDEGSEPALAFFLGRWAVTALVLETNCFRVTSPQVVVKEAERQAVRGERKGRVQLEATTVCRPTNGTEVLGRGMMCEVKGGGVLNDKHGCILTAALECSLGMGLKDRR